MTNNCAFSRFSFLMYFYRFLSYEASLLGKEVILVLSEFDFYFKTDLIFQALILMVFLSFQNSRFLETSWICFCFSSSSSFPKIGNLNISNPFMKQSS